MAMSPAPGANAGAARNTGVAPATNQGTVAVPAHPGHLKALLMRWNALVSQGVKEETHHELSEICRMLRLLTKQQQQYEKRQRLLEEKRKKVPSDKLELLKTQLKAYGLLSRNLDVPAPLQTQLLESAGVGEAKASREPSVEVDGTPAAGEKDEGPGLENGPATKLPTAQLTALLDSTKEQSVGGVAETIIANRITQRIAELERLPANIGTVKLDAAELLDCKPDDALSAHDDRLKISAIVELKALRLLTKQKSMRQHIVYNMAPASDPVADSITHRAQFRRVNAQTAHELRLTEQLENQQRLDRERREREMRLRHVQGIVEHVDSFRKAMTRRRQRQAQFGRAILQAHNQIEKEESKKLERTAKQRLQALKANDEVAYLKLLDQTKDTRITHLLKQTNAFLSSLTAAVKVQQAEGRAQSAEPAPPPTVNGAEDGQGGGGGDNDEDEHNIDYYGVAHRIKEKIERQPSILVGGTLKEYQIRGLEWMVSLYNNNLNGILADEMGLGKTIQSISLITYLIEIKKQPGPYLVIVPLSTITNWTMEFEKWAPSVKTVVYKGPPNARKGQAGVIKSGDFQVVLTTYEYIIKDRPILSKIKWIHMIIDEGHRMKNTQSKLSSTLTQYYYSRHRLILTGTPLQNNLPELWALLNFVLPKIFNSVKTFDEWFNTPFANTGGQDRMELTEEETLLVIRRLHKVLRPFLLRRLKKDVEKDLPDKVERVVKCQMSALQLKLYEMMLKHNALFVGDSSGDKTKNSIRGLNNKIMQLRKICNHPFVFDEVENLINPSGLTNNDLWRVAGKFELLDRIFPKFQATGHRVLIFFQMTQVMDIMEDYMRFRGIQYLRLDGSTKAEDRTSLLGMFNAPDSPYFAFLLSTRAGGLGLNLQTADTVIIYDTDWNPHQDLQAQDRAHRIGQTKEVRILRLITEDSVEEAILERAHSKLEIDGKVIQAGKFDQKSTSEEQEAFLRTLIEAEEARRGQKDEHDEMDDDELNEILARSAEEQELFKKIDDERNATSMYGKGRDFDRLFGEDELPEEYTRDMSEHFEPRKDDEYLGRGARERKVVYYDDGLTEGQWLAAMDNDDVDIEDVMRRKRERLERRAEKAARGARGSTEPRSDMDDDADSVSTPASKRKRRSTSAAANNNRAATPASAGDMSDDEASEVPRKKARGRPSKNADSLSKEDRATLTKHAKELVNAVLETTEDETGRRLADIFAVLPSRAMYPDYYLVIKDPIALDIIQKKIRANRYTSLGDVKADFDLMWSNAKTYNEVGSFVYNDAETLGAIVDSRYRDLTGSGTENGTDRPRLKLKLGFKA